MIALVATLALACAEPDGGTCVQQLNIGPYNETILRAGGGGATGMYTTHISQWPGYPQYACLQLTQYMGVCTSFARSSYNPTYGTGGSLNFYNGAHRAVQFSDWGDFSPVNDDDLELGWPGPGTKYNWKRLSTYEHVIASRALTCSAQADGGCFTDSAPRGSTVRFTCPGPGICEWAPGHEYLDNVWHSSIDGMQTCVMNVTEYPLLVRDVDGAVELDGDADWLGGRFASLCLERVGDRWVEKSRKAP